LLKLDESFRGDRVKLGVGETLQIELSEKRTSGFRWRLTEEAAMDLKVISDEFVAPATTDPPGTAGIHTWKLEAKKEGTTKLEFEYSRSWEGSDKATRKFAVTIQIAG
jgi:predicted secreted protein